VNPRRFDPDPSTPRRGTADVPARAALADGSHRIDDPSRAPRVTVVLPTYRRPQHLARAIATVQAQTFTDWELIVVDDNDPRHPDRRGTQQAVSKHLDDPRIRFVRHDDNRGGSAARNTGIRAARAAWIAFLDDDDEWHATKLERQLALAERSATDVALVYCRIRARHDGTGRESVYRSEPDKCNIRDLFRRNHIGGTSCVMCRADALHEVGMFDEALASRQDIDLYVRLAGRYAFAFVDAALVTMNLHGDGRISTNLRSKVKGHTQFFEKHRAQIEADPIALRARLKEMGRFLLASHDLLAARRVLGRAWSLEVRDGVALRRLLLTFPTVRSARTKARRVLGI
jgi:glycosyltransferase involved in cell wall biosynthesis